MSAALDLIALRARVGGQVYDGGRRWIGPGPGHSRQDRSLSVSLLQGRPLLHSFAGDTFIECAKHLGIERGEARPETRIEAMQRRAAASAECLRQEAFCRSVWHETMPLSGSAAEAYLQSRGVALQTQDVRFHPAAPRCWPRDVEPPPLPAMAAKVRSAQGAPKGLHVTYVTDDGRKALGDRSRLMFGPVSGGAVWLAPVTREGTLAVAEGIETAAAFTALFGLPCWAALSTSGMQNFQLPASVRRLVIAADGDEPGAKAAHLLADRARRVCDVEIHSPPTGLDWCDGLNREPQNDR